MSDSQSTRILQFMKAGGSITGLEAVMLFGCLHLPRRILDIKEKGHTVRDRWVEVNGKTVKEYFMGSGK